MEPVYVTVKPDTTHLDVDSARQAANQWARRPLADRVMCLKRTREMVVECIEPLLDAVIKDTGKTRTEALATDLLPTLEQMRFNEQYAHRLLAEERRPNTILFPGSRPRVIHEPYGIVLIITPWNNPLQLSLLPVAFQAANDWG